MTVALDEYPLLAIVICNVHLPLLIVNYFSTYYYVLIHC